MLRFKYRIYIILFLFIPVFSTGALGNNKTVDSSSVIQVRDNLLTVKVRDISLKKVLREIANPTPMKIVFFAPAEELIVAAFSRLPMEKGLKRLLRDYNYTITYDSEKSKVMKHESIKKVIILSNEGKSQKRKAESMMVFTEEPSLESLREDPYDEDLDIPEEDMLDPLEEAEPMIVSTEESSLESLSKDLYDEDPDTREDAVYSLEELEDVRSIDLLIEVLLNDEDEGVRMSASVALGSIGSEIAIDSLREALQDEDAVVRESAVEALGLIGGVRAIEALEVALSDEDEDVKELATEELRLLKE